MPNSYEFIIFQVLVLHILRFFSLNWPP